jgi:hypothetical protein
MPSFLSPIITAINLFCSTQAFPKAIVTAQSRPSESLLAASRRRHHESVFKLDNVLNGTPTAPGPPRCDLVTVTAAPTQPPSEAIGPVADSLMMMSPAGMRILDPEPGWIGPWANTGWAAEMRAVNAALQ